MAIVCDNNNTADMDQNPSSYNNQHYMSGYQGYYDNYQQYPQHPNPQFSVPPPGFQPFYAEPPQFYPPQLGYNNNAQYHGDHSMTFYGHEARPRGTSYYRGQGNRREGAARGKAGSQYEVPSSNPQKESIPVVEENASDSLDEYLQSYIDGEFDNEGTEERSSESSQTTKVNKTRRNANQGESRGNSQRQNYDYENVENRQHYTNGNRGRGGRGGGRYDGSRSGNDWRSSGRNRNNDVQYARDNADLPTAVQERIRDRKMKEKFNEKPNSALNLNEKYSDHEIEDRHGDRQQYLQDRPTDGDRQQFSNSSRRGQRSGRGRQSNQGRLYSDYEPQKEVHPNASAQERSRKNYQDRESNTSGFKGQGNSVSNENETKYHMPAKNIPGQRNQSRRPFMARTLSGKVDESQRGVLIEQLTNNTYECMVCCDTVRCQNAIWGCSNCFHVFHLRCVKKWARSPAALVDGEDGGWRCPACQNTCEKFPSQYRCFCSKVRDPEFHRMEIPHSCGEVCGKQRADNCPHPCNILCHPGPCPPCNAVISRSCDCGKTSQTMKCSASQIIKCEEKCGKQLNCGRHFCKVTCHAGSCSMCEEVIVQECYKDHTKREVVCGSKASFQKSFSCEKPCQKTLACGNHTCEDLCHEGACGTCSLSPPLVHACPCGTTPLVDLPAALRTSCLDPIPICGAVCKKTLNCGPPDDHHTCKKKCHEGPCGACKGHTLLKCRCGALEKDFTCAEAQNMDEDHPFCCDKRCSKKRLCGRHKCGQVCCVLEKEDHFCDFICGKKLSCGLHKCDELCHRGNCQPCLLASFEELTCHCGSEVRFPPVPCGTRPPECFNKCTRTHSCSHPVRHNCHSDENCPPCAELTSKFCMGEHELRKNIPCHIINITCGLPCDKPLPCGQHKCIRTCHKGVCLEEVEKCVQACPTKRSVCGHPCGMPCHSGRDCPAFPCKAEITIKCPCGMKSARQSCLAGGPSPELVQYQKLTVQTLASTAGAGQSVDMSTLTSAAKKTTKRQLECDSECAIVERNRRMALVLEIKNPDLNAKLGNPPYTDFLKEYARSFPQNVASIDKAYSELVKNAKASKHPHRSHQFPPMNRDQRRVVHELAEFYGCETQSYDFEPKKNVVATAYKDKCWLPSITLTAMVQRELHPKAPTPIPHVRDEEAIRKSASAAKRSTCLLPGQSTKPVTWATKTASSGAARPKNTKPDKHIDYFDFSEG